MPWEYHCGHLFKTMVEEIGKTLEDQVDSIMDKGRKTFSSYFSDSHVTVLDGYRDTDFNSLPCNE